MKNVTFDRSKNKIYMIVTWMFTYRNALRIYWRLEAIDRTRFKRRVTEFAKIIIYPILSYQHRCKNHNDLIKNYIWKCVLF